MDFYGKNQLKFAQLSSGPGGAHKGRVPQGCQRMGRVCLIYLLAGKPGRLPHWGVAPERASNFLECSLV